MLEWMEVNMVESDTNEKYLFILYLIPFIFGFFDWVNYPGLKNYNGTVFIRKYLALVVVGVILNGLTFFLQGISRQKRVTQLVLSYLIAWCGIFFNVLTDNILRHITVIFYLCLVSVLVCFTCQVLLLRKNHKAATR